MKSFRWSAWAAVGIGLTAGCTGEMTEDGAPAVQEWTLVADDEGALVDAEHPDGKYPNGRGLEWLRVVLHADGKLCATDGDSRVCGGPLQGIPYTVRLGREGDLACLRVVDLYGTRVREHCGDVAVPDESQIAPIATGEFAEVPGCGDQGSEVLLGAKLFVEELNASLLLAGIEASLAIPTAADLMDVDAGDISLAQPSCADVVAYLDDEFADDHAGTDDYVFGADAIAECLETGRCRMGQLVTRAMAAACERIPSACGDEDTTRGIVGSAGYALTAACPGDEQAPEFQAIDSCVGSPLVLDLGAPGLSLTPPGHAAPFATFSAEPMSTGWIAGEGDALLAIDLDGDGAVTSGRELFGEATGGWAPDGFAALARHDANGDGAIDRDDPVYSRLLAWIDDGDARSMPSELVSLDALGIASISLDARAVGATHPSGNELGLAAGALLESGGSISVIDVWFATGR